jgi:tetrathionate reductase subunit C
MPDYVAVPHVAYNWMIAVYFFLGGLGAGAFVLSVAANYWKQEFKPVAKTASIVAPIAIAIGLFFLWIDLGRPFRVWRLFVSFNPTSALSWGVWFLNIFFALSVLYAGLLAMGQIAKAKLAAYAGLPFAILVGTYTGILLAQSPGRALWHSALIPVLFLNGGLISGIAIVILLSVGRQNGDVLSKLGKVVGALVALEVGLVTIELIALLNGGAASVEAGNALLTGMHGFLFLGVEMVLGALIPVIILLRNKVGSAALATASALVLIGIFTMRYVIILGGQATN